MITENHTWASKANAWDRLNEYLEEKVKNNPTLKYISQEVSNKLHEDGCYSAWIHRAELIDRLVEIIEDQREDLKS